MSIFQPQNPGIGGIDELTPAEEAFLTSLAGLSYSDGDIIYFSGSNMTNLAIGTQDQILAVSAGGVPEWVDSGTITGTLTTVKNNGVQIGGTDIVTLDFSTDFDLTETPDTEINISIDYCKTIALAIALG